MDTPLVSVIVPNYNHQPFLEQRLESIFGQTFQDFEVILLDDASTDSSVRIIEKYRSQPKVSQVIINAENSGSPFKQWQRGVHVSRGTYIWIAESDDFAAPNFLETTVQQLQNGAQICYVQSYDVDGKGELLSNRLEYTAAFSPNIWRNNFVIDGKTFLERYLAEKNVIPNASAVVFQKQLVPPSFFSEEMVTMKLCGDWFFWIQLLPKATVSFVAQPLNYFRIHEGVSRSYKNLEKRKRRILEEVTCRNYLKKEFGISKPEKDKALVLAWSQLHSKWAPFQKGFYRFKLGGIHTISLLLSFVKVKLKYK